MNLIVTGHQIDLTRSLKDYISSKLKRLDRHSNQVDDAHVVLSVEKIRQKAEATVTVAGKRLFATTTQDNMYAAIDLLIDKLDRQLLKTKQHNRKDWRKSAEKLLG